MKVLYLTLNKKWFDMIASGIKKHEYREIKKYWLIRLLDFSNVPREKPLDKSLICENIMFDLSNGYSLKDVLNDYHVSLKHYDCVVAKNGYSKDARCILWESKGIKVGTGVEEWGAEPDREYLTLNIGNVVLNPFDQIKGLDYQFGHPKLRERTKARVLYLLSIGMVYNGYSSLGFKGIGREIYILLIYELTDTEFIMIVNVHLMFKIKNKLLP